MLDHLKAVQALLEPLGYPTHRDVSPDAAPPYLVLSAPGWGDAAEASVCASRESADVSLRVMATAGTTDGVRIMHTNVRRLLDRSHPRLEGRHLTVLWERSEFVDVDRDVTIPGTNRHPAWGVETYRLVSEPA